jgi:outer membrane biosynthesis protein TonB
MRRVSWKPGRAGVVCGIFLLQAAFGAAFAQSADTPAAAAPPAAADAAKDTGPFGGCEPIGMTASGELVFPLECKHKLKLPAAPVASEEPAVDNKPVAAAEAKPAAPEDKAVVTPEKTAVADKPAAETKAAAVEDKPAPVASAAEVKPVAVQETLTTTDKTPAAAEHKSAEANAEAPAAMEKAASETPAKHSGRHAAKATGAGKPAKQVVAVARPVQAQATSAHAAAPSAVQTASLPACTHYRSYNAATKSYLGFDGHKYACR